ncbi:MAG: omptin family outer membrane protease, partial [Spirochaetales bacterium]|nr:omptin family outer membrane protease [Spirochaetales bacterium]MDY5915617.1 omptin family outer membrane protease [Treponema sp.]
MNKKAFFTLFVLLITSFTFAQNKIISVDAKANISLLNGSISEYVFTPASHNTDDVLSRLDWDVKNVPIVSVSVDLTLFKYAYFNLGAGFGFPSTPSGNMQDYDWLNCIPIKNGGFGLPKQYGTELTNYSIHDNFLNSYRNIFVKIGYNFYLPLKITITPFVAYNYEYLGFDGFDGYRKYKKENWQKIEFSGNVISYFQETNAFLVGIKLISPVLFNLKIDGEFLISPYTSNINALDKHHIRKTHFMDLMPWSYQLQSSLNLSYSI